MSMTVRDYSSHLNTKNSLLKSSRTQKSLMNKLSSGYKINKGSDDPAGLLISEMLRSQLSGYQRAWQNTQETNNMMSIAEGGLTGVSTMLGRMKTLATHALNSGVTTGGQVQADQMEMNSALSSINRIVSTTNYAGTNLLDGTKDFDFEVGSSGLVNEAGTSISNINGSVPNQIAVSYDGETAHQAEKAYVEADFGGANLTEAQEFTVAGNGGSRTFSFGAGTSIAEMAEQINASASSTGVNAYAIRDDGTGATSLRLVSEEYGSAQEVRVDQHAGSGFAAAGGRVMDKGQDATVQVDGKMVTGDGLNVEYATGGVTGELSLSEQAAQTGYDQDTLVDAGTAQNSALTNIKGGMQLQLGEGSGQQNREQVSLGNYSSGRLGQVEYNGETYSINDLYGGGAASLQNNPELAMKIIDQAIDDVASGRANIGAYQANTLETNANNLMATIENTTRTESEIRDADMAKLISELTSANLQKDAGLRVLQMQKMNATNVLQLLGGGK